MNVEKYIDDDYKFGSVPSRARFHTICADDLSSGYLFHDLDQRLGWVSLFRAISPEVFLEVYLLRFYQS